MAKLPKPYLALDPDMMTENYERCKQLLVLPTDKALLEMVPARSAGFAFRPLHQPPNAHHQRQRTVKNSFCPGPAGRKPNDEG